MKITLLKYMGRIGVITEYRPLIPSKISVEIDGEREGKINVGCKGYQVKDGIATISEWDVLAGENKVTFTDSNGQIYDCGKLWRNGSFIEIRDDIRSVVVKGVLATEAQAKEISRLQEEINIIKKQYGISIV